MAINVEGSLCLECSKGIYKKSDIDSTALINVYRCTKCEDKVTRPTTLSGILAGAGAVVTAFTIFNNVERYNNKNNKK